MARQAHTPPDTAPAADGNLGLAYTLLFVAPIFFAANNVVARGMVGIMPPVAMSFWRWTVAFLLLLPFLAVPLWRLRGTLLREAPSLFLLGGLGMSIAGTLPYIGARTTPAINIGFIFAATPAVILLLDWLITQQRPTARQGMGMVACLLGMCVFLLRGNLDTLHDLGFSPGDVWVGAGALGYSLYSVVLKAVPTRLGGATRFAGIAFCGSLLILPFYVAENALSQQLTFDLRSLSVILFLGLFAGVATLLPHAYITKILGPKRTTVLLFLGPLYTVALAGAFLGEQLLPYHLVGSALILPGVYLVIRDRKPATKRQSG